MLPQAVTTVWRTELGTTLLNGFNSTTDLSAYFRYLCLHQSARNRRTVPTSCERYGRGWERALGAPSSSPYGPVQRAVASHELRQLLELAIPDFPFLQDFRPTLPEYTEFAVRLRYDELPWITGEDARAAFAVVARLRDEVGAALGFLE